MTHTDEWVVNPCTHTTRSADPPRPTGPSRSLGVCSTNTAHPPVCHSLDIIAWGSWCPLCLGYKAQLPVQPVPLFTDPNTLRTLSYLFLKQSAIFTSPLPILLTMFLPTDHKEKPGFHSYPKFPVTAGHLSFSSPIFLCSISMAS